MKQIKLHVIGINAIPAGDDKYYMTAAPVNDADASINPKNRYGYSTDQLLSVAGNMGLPNIETLIKVLNKGGCIAIIPVELRKVGETYTDKHGIERKYGHDEAGNLKAGAKDWWETDVIATTFEYSDIAAEFVEKVELQELAQINLADTMNRRNAADTRRRQALGRMAAASGQKVINIGGVLDPAAETVDADAVVVDSTSGTGGGGRRSGANAGG